MGSSPGRALDAGLAAVLRTRRDEIVQEWARAVVSLGPGQHRTRPALLDHVPELLDELAARIEAGDDSAPPGARTHARWRLEEGAELRDVVAEYALLRGTVLRIWAPGAPADERFAARFLDALVDGAIAEAVDAFTAERDRGLAALDRISAAALESRDLEELLSRLLAILATSPAIDTASILIREGERLRVRAAIGLEEEVTTGFSVGIGEGLAGTVAAARRAIALRDAANDPLVTSPIVRARGVRALVGVPLESGGELLGVATVGSLTSYELSAADERLFRSTAERAASGIRLHLARAEAERRASDASLRVLQQAAVAALGRHAVRDAPIPALLQEAVERVADVLGAELVLVARLEEDVLRVVAGVGWRPGVVGAGTLPVGRGSQSGLTLLRGEPVVVEDYLSDPRFTPAPLITSHGGGSGVSAVVAGRSRDARPFGTLAAFSRRPRAYSPEDVHFVEAMANVLADVIGRSRAQADLAFVARATDALAATLDLGELLERVASLPVPYLADACVVDVVPGAGGWRWAVHHRERARRRLLQVARARFDRPPWLAATLEHGVAVVHRDARAEVIPALRASHPEAAAELAALDPLSIAAVPIALGGRVLGALTLGTTAASGRRIGDPEVALASELARRVALAVESARLFAEAQREIRLREDVLAVVSHDLRGPLGTISFGVGALSRTAAAEDAVSRQVATIRRAVSRMDRLIRDLLEMARIRAGRLVLALGDEDVDPLLDEALAAAAAVAAERRIRLERNDPPLGGVRVRCDRDRVLQVLDNLLGNALRVTPPGGRITVGAERRSGAVRLSVIDSGPGVREADLEAIFEPWWARPVRTGTAGTGLGLFIARGIVEAHGGRIWAERSRDAGAIFRFELPAS